MMTPDQILLVQTSFQMMGADGTALASTLGSRLAIRELALRGRLTGTPAEQARLLARLLVLAVRGLSRSRVLHRLRARLGSGPLVEDEFAAVGRALLDSVEELLGAAVPRSVREAWQAGYRMQAGLLRATACPA
jgi:hemoglobin-like flavoprotein